MQSRPSTLSAVILAPRQLSEITGERSLLQGTIERILSMVATERVLVVVTEVQQEMAWRHLDRWPEIKLVVEPEDCGTGPAILVALTALLERDRAGRCVVLPSDHDVCVAEPLLAAIDDAAEAASWNPAHASILGAVPDSADGDHEWIFPGQSLGRFGLHRVLCYAARAPSWTAARLQGTAAVWNTSILVGTTRRLLEVCRAGLPRHAARIAVAMDAAPARIVGRLAEAYASLPEADLDVMHLERAAGVYVRPFAGAGWTDQDTRTP